MRAINSVLKKEIVEHNSRLTAEQLTEEFRKVHRIQDALTAKAKLLSDDCEKAACIMNLPHEEAFKWLDNNGWVDVAIDAWNVIGSYTCISEFDTVDIWASRVIPFLADYMDNNYEDYKSDDHGGYRFSTAIRTNTNEWDIYSNVLFLPIEYMCIMLQLETI